MFPIAASAKKKTRPAAREQQEARLRALAGEEPERVEREGHLDQPLLLLTLLLLAIGLICLFSASYATAYDTQDGNAAYFIIRQGVFAGAGVVVMLLLSRFDYHKLHYLAIPALLFAVAVMATVKIPGLKNYWKTINDATRWIALPGVGTFQPSELAKVAVILSFSSFSAIFGKKICTRSVGGFFPFSRSSACSPF